MKSSTLIKLSLSAVALLCGAATAQAATIVQLGAQGGDIGMVTATDTGPNTTLVVGPIRPVQFMTQRLFTVRLAH